MWLGSVIIIGCVQVASSHLSTLELRDATKTPNSKGYLFPLPTNSIYVTGSVSQGKLSKGNVVM
jgi:hypothetical protein